MVPLDPFSPHECNCDGRVRKRGGEKGLAHFIFQLRNLTNQILLVAMRIVGFQIPVAEVYVNRLVLQALNVVLVLRASLRNYTRVRGLATLDYVTDYSPIARAFYRIDESVEKQMKMKFDVAYTIAKEGMAFTKMSCLCQLQERHGVRLGECDQACAIFTAQDLQGQLCESLCKA